MNEYIIPNKIAIIEVIIDFLGDIPLRKFIKERIKIMTPNIIKIPPTQKNLNHNPSKLYIYVTHFTHLMQKLRC